MQKLKAAAADNLKAVILYGSAATDEFHAKHSDLNILCLVEQADAAHLEALHSAGGMVDSARSAPAAGFHSGRTSAVRRYFHDRAAGHEIPSPHFVRRECAGGNFRAACITMRSRSSANLRTDWLRLRQAILAAPKKPKVYLELMVASFSSFAALFRHALIALGEAPAESKREAIDRIAKFAGADPAGFHAILDISRRKSERTGNRRRENAEPVFCVRRSGHGQI